MSLLIFCAILATLFFWAVGAYNRLVVLRANVAKQFAAVDAQLLRVLVWLQGNLPASMRDMLSEMEEAALPEALLKNERDLKLLDILEALSDSLDAARTQPLSSEVMQQVNQNRLALAAWAKAEVRAGQSGEATWFIDPLPYKFDRLKAQAWPLMDAYNQAAAKYNEAVTQFPASVLAKQVKFVPAHTLDIADLLA
jgi:LemA protein